MKRLIIILAAIVFFLSIIIAFSCTDNKTIPSFDEIKIKVDSVVAKVESETATARGGVKGKPKPPVSLPATALSVTLTSPAPGQLHWEWSPLNAGEEIIWTFIDWGTTDSAGVWTKLGGLPIYQSSWSPDVQNYPVGGDYVYTLPAGTWTIRITVVNGVLSDATTWNVSFSNLLTNFVAN